MHALCMFLPIRDFLGSYVGIRLTKRLVVEKMIGVLCLIFEVCRLGLSRFAAPGAHLKRFAENLDHRFSRNAEQHPVVARVSSFADGSG